MRTSDNRLMGISYGDDKSNEHNPAIEEITKYVRIEGVCGCLDWKFESESTHSVLKITNELLLTLGELCVLASRHMHAVT